MADENNFTISYANQALIITRGNEEKTTWVMEVDPKTASSQIVAKFIQNMRNPNPPDSIIFMDYTGDAILQIKDGLIHLILTANNQRCLFAATQTFSIDTYGEDFIAALERIDYGNDGCNPPNNSPIDDYFSD